MTRLLFILLTFLSFFAHGVVMAQATPEQQLEQQEEEAEEERIFGDLSEADVAAFAAAHYRVRELDRQFARDLRHRAADEDPEQMQEKMTEKREALIAEAGLSSESYRRILSAMAHNEALRDHVESLEAAHKADNN